jgi:hypothetical protein
VVPCPPLKFAKVVSELTFGFGLLAPQILFEFENGVAQQRVKAAMDLRQWLFEFYVGSGGAQVPNENGLNVAADRLMAGSRREICYNLAKFGV